MDFIRTADDTQAIEEIAGLIQSLTGLNQRVLWLTSGGSNSNASAKIMHRLSASASLLLTIGQIDERFGPVGHADSNWQALLSAGFEAQQATTLPMLQAGQTSKEQAAEQYAAALQTTIESSDTVIAQLGIGADRHIAGILPDSPATSADQQLVTAYSGPDFERITLTFPALRQIQKAYVLTYGESKRAALMDLRAGGDLSAQPCQILHELPEVYIYNDQIGVPA